MVSIKGIVFDIARYSTHDGPGIRTTVFLKGCPLTCAWCHNPESQRTQPELMLRPGLCVHCLECLPVCPQAAIQFSDGFVTTDLTRCQACGACVQVCLTGARELAGREMSVEQVMAVIDQEIPFFEESAGGVTFSGGEPLAQPEFLGALLRACRTRGLHTVLDTSGLVAWETLDGIRAWVNLFYFDLKAVSDNIHRRFTGVSNRLILQNLRRLNELGHPVVLRVPLIPGVNDSPAELQRIGQLAASLPNIQRVHLLPYHRIGIDKYARLQREYTLAEIQPPTPEQVQVFAELLSPYCVNIQIGG